MHIILLQELLVSPKLMASRSVFFYELSTRFHKENSGRITYLTKVRFFYERYCTRVTLKNNKWLDFTHWIFFKPASQLASFAKWLRKRILRFLLKLNLEFRKLRSFKKRRSCDEKKCLNFFYFWMVMTHFGHHGVSWSFCFFFTCTGGTGKWKQFDSVGKFSLLYSLLFISFFSCSIFFTLSLCSAAQSWNKT